MTEYIDREAVIQYLLKCADGYSYIETPTDSAITDIKSMPAVDVRSVVLCRDCEYCRKEDEHEYWCYGFCSPARLVRKDDFCSHGCKNG